MPLKWKHRVLTTGPPGKSLDFIVYRFKLCLNPCGVSIIIKPTGTSYRERQWGHRPWGFSEKEFYELLSILDTWILCLHKARDVGWAETPDTHTQETLACLPSGLLEPKSSGTSTLGSKLGLWFKD